MGRISSTARTTAWNCATRSSVTTPVNRLPEAPPQQTALLTRPEALLGERERGRMVRVKIRSSMSLANRISIFRILLVPAIVASLVYYHPERDALRFLALGLFLIGVASDAMDGFVARWQNQQTELGAILDPIADKLLILGALISCSMIRGLPEWMRIPAWFNLLVISRDVLLVVGSLLLVALRIQWTVKPSRMGKWTTFAQMLVIPSVLLNLPLKSHLVTAAAVLTVLSGIGYIRTGIRLLS